MVQPQSCEASVIPVSEGCEKQGSLLTHVDRECKQEINLSCVQAWRSIIPAAQPSPVQREQRTVPGTRAPETEMKPLELMAILGSSNPGPQRGRDRRGLATHRPCAKWLLLLFLIN